MSIDPADRDHRVISTVRELQELEARPSQHSAAYTKKAASQAIDIIESLLGDLRGWERQAEGTA